MYEFYTQTECTIIYKWINRKDPYRYEKFQILEIKGEYIKTSQCHFFTYQLDKKLNRTLVSTKANRGMITVI